MRDVITNHVMPFQLQAGNYAFTNKYADIKGKVAITDWRFGSSDDEWALRVSVAAREGTYIDLPLGRIEFIGQTGEIQIKYIWNGQTTSMGRLLQTDFIKVMASMQRVYRNTSSTRRVFAYWEITLAINQNGSVSTVVD